MISSRDGELESHSLLGTLHAEGSILPRAEPSEALMLSQLNKWSQHLAAQLPVRQDCEPCESLNLFLTLLNLGCNDRGG